MAKRKHGKVGRIERLNQAALLRNVAVRFLLWFALLHCAAFLLPLSVPASFSRHTAQASARLVSIVSGIQPAVDGIRIACGGFAVRVVSECTALHPSILYLAFVLAWPSSRVRKAAGIVAGIAALHAVNIARIAGVFLLGVAAPRWFDPVHVYAGQAVMLLIVVAAAWLWSQEYPSRVNKMSIALWFAIRFLASSAGAFLLLWAIQDGYWAVMKSCVGWWFLRGGIVLRFPENLPVLHYAHFNLAAFSGLFLAALPLLSRRRAMVLSFLGPTVLVSGHLLHLALNAYWFGLHAPWSETLWIHAGLLMQYLLPVLLVGTALGAPDRGPRKLHT